MCFQWTRDLRHGWGLPTHWATGSSKIGLSWGHYFVLPSLSQVQEAWVHTCVKWESLNITERNKKVISHPDWPLQLFWECIFLLKCAPRETFLQHVVMLLFIKEAENSSDILRGKTFPENELLYTPLCFHTSINVCWLRDQTRRSLQWVFLIWMCV